MKRDVARDQHGQPISPDTYRMLLRSAASMSAELVEADGLAQQIHETIKRPGARSHGLIGNLRCILDHIAQGSKNHWSDETAFMDSAMFAGVRIIESPHIRPVPKLQMSPTFKWCSEEFRGSMNTFLLNTFGTKTVAYMLDGTLVTPPGTITALRRIVAKKNHQ